MKTNSGLQRLNVLGAYSPDDHTLIAIEDTVSCDAEMVCRLLYKLRATHPDAPLLLVLDDELASLMTERFHLFGQVS